MLSEATSCLINIVVTEADDYRQKYLYFIGSYRLQWILFRPAKVPNGEFPSITLI